MERIFAGKISNSDELTIKYLDDDGDGFIYLENSIKIIVGNKNDLEGNRKVSENVGRARRIPLFSQQP